MRIDVAIIEDDDAVRECLQTLLERSTECRCRRVFQSGEAAIPELLDEPVQVVLVDIGLPGISGIHVIRKLKRKNPAMKSVMLTVYEDDEKIFSALEAGADGYILKRSSPEEILRAVKEVHLGGAPMTGIIARKVIQHFRQTPAELASVGLSSLSNREGEILELLAKGDLYKEIAAKLGISYETVHSHIRRIYEKLHVRSRAQAVSKLIQS